MVIACFSQPIKNTNMKYKILFFIAFSGLFVSCNDIEKTMEEKASISVSKYEIPLKELITSECYRYINNKDTIVLHLNNVDNVINGQLYYNLYEKDNNKGVFEGTFDGDILIAYYTFKSENKNYIRQIAFKKQGYNLVEGYGDMEEKNGKMIFIDIPSIHFDTTSVVLKVIDCLE